MSYTASYIVNSSSAQGTTDFQFTFPYIKEEHIEVYLNYSKITQGSGSAQYQVITNVSPKLVRLNTGIASANLRVEVRRNSSLGSPLVDYADGSTLTANDLDTSALQSLYIDQELKDNQGKTVSVDEATGLPTLNNLRLTNVGDPTSAQDAATKNYVDTTAEPKSAKLTELATMAQNTANALADLTATEVQAIDGLTASTDELNKLDGVTATTAELNYIDGVTSNVQTQLDAKQPLDTELTELATMGSTTASALADLTQAEVQILDGATVTTDELNKLDGVTASTTELNYVDGVTSNVQTQLDTKQPLDAELTELATMSSGTASALADLTQAEVETLDGLTATTAELNKLDGVTATTNELNKTDGLLATPTELNALDGITSNTSELNKLDGVTASTTELNIVAGKSFKTSSGTLDTTSDTEIPSSKVIAAHVASSQTAIGGFTTIADEVSFPNTQPANGVVVSINNAAGVVINGSGVSTSGKRVDNTTVTINGFPSSLNGETLAAGVGLIVVSTSTANTYSYHKILTSETDVKQLSDDINDFNSRYRIASSAPGSNNDEGDLYFDTNANKMKVYNGSAWDDVASVGSFFVNTLSSSSGTGGGSATFNGSAYRFTLSNAGQSAQQHIVSINGVVQKPNSGTSQPSEGFAIDSNDIIFSAAPASGSDFFIITCGSSVSIGTPSANSVNSSHIIDGSIVDGDISSSANIALSKLNTTGTASASTFLLGNGAWTNTGIFASTGGGGLAGDWSWEEQAGNTYFRLLTSGDGSVELKHGADFNIDDGSKIQIGTGDDLQIYHNGTNSFIENSTGSLYIRDTSGGDVRIQGKSGEDSIICNDDGSVDLYHDNSKKLETTSGGINVTGAINVNGTALSAAPEITATASGTIAANAAVNLKSDGKVQAVAAVTAGTTESLAGETDPNEEWHRTRWTYDTEQKKIIHWWRDEASGDFECRVGTPSGSAASASVTWSSIIDTGFDIANFDAYFDPQSKRHIILYYNVYEIKAVPIQLNSNGTLTVGNESTLTGNNAANGALKVTMARAYDTGGASSNRQIFYTYQYLQGTRKVYFGFFKANSDNTISNINSDNQLGSQNGSAWNDFASCWDPNNLLSIMVATRASDDRLYMNYHRAKYDDQKGSFNVHTGGYNGCPIPIDESNTVGIGYRDNSDSGKLKLRIGTPSTSSGDEAASMSFSSAYDLTSTAATVGGNFGNWIGKDTETNRYYFAYTKTSNSTSYLKYFTVDASSSVTVESGDGLLIKNNDIYKGVELMFDLNLKQMMVGCVIDTGSSDYEAAVYIGHGATTSATNGNFIGFSSAGYSDGDAATIKVVGNTTTQSSLTPAQKYYVQHNGSLSTTPADPSIEAGIALSSTKLLIKG